MLGKGTIFEQNKLVLSAKDRRILAGVSLVSLLFFSLSFLVLRSLHYPNFPVELINKLSKRVLSSVHAIVVGYFCLAYLWQYHKPSLFLKSLGWSCGYFLFVLIFLFFEENYKECIMQGIHHSSSFLVFVFYAKRFLRVAARCLLAVLTGPFLYFSWYLIHINQGESLLFKIFGIMTLAIWALVRVANFTDVYIQGYRQKAARLSLFVFSPVLLLNYYWFYLLLRKAYFTFFVA